MDIRWSPRSGWQEETGDSAGEEEVVRFLFANYLSENICMKELARRLRQKNIPTRLRRAVAIHNTSHILTNRMVVGQVRILRRRFRLNWGYGATAPPFQ